MFTEFQKYIKMRERLCEGLGETLVEHLDEVQAGFTSDPEMQELCAQALEDGLDEDSEELSNLFFEYADWWLIQQGYAFWDDRQGMLPINWASVPREQWGEVPDPTLIGPWCGAPPLSWLPRPIHSTIQPSNI